MAEIRVGVPHNLPLPTPEGANFFHFTIVGQEVQFLVGSINLLRLHEAKRSGEPANIVPEITHRFTLSPMGWNALKASMDEITPSAPKSDVSVTAETK